MGSKALVSAAAWAALLTAVPALAQTTTEDALAEYRAMFGDDNPATFWEMRGEGLWKEPRGPRNVALAKVCDLGVGVGVIKGAYARLPRYFSDSGRVEDLESRLLGCMVGLQGLDREELLDRRFGDGAKKSELEALTAYLAGQSRGATITLPLQHPAEKLAYAIGREIFFYRAGTHDFACATCHGESGKRIRLQSLPNLSVPAEAQFAYTTWPGYRISQGELRTMEWRIADCFRQQRLPELQYGSEAAVALITYLAKNAEGGVMDAPSLKR